MFSNEDYEVFNKAREFAAGVGEAVGMEGPVAKAAIEVAAGAGAAVGVGIEHLTNHAISGAIADGLGHVVGPEESLAAANAFSDGDVMGGVGHMATGAWHTGVDEAEHLAHGAAEWLGLE